MTKSLEIIEELKSFGMCIIDADPLIYRCGFSVEKTNKETDIIEIEPIQNAYYNINNMIKKTLKATGAKDYTLILTAKKDKTNFRYDIFPLYKDNRKEARKPIYYSQLREYLQKTWKAYVVSGQEADDECSILHCKYNNLGFENTVLNSVVCSFDKDFNNIPGWHYNYIKDELYYLTEIEALRNFYLQILTGDTSDGIPRIKKGWRQKEAEEAISEAKTEKEMFDIVYKVIYNVLKEDENNQDLEVLAKDTVLSRGRLVWLRRQQNEMWEPNLK